MLYGSDHGLGLPGIRLLPPQLPAFLLQRRHTHNLPVIRAALENPGGDGSSSFGPKGPDSSQLSSSGSLGAGSPSSIHFQRPVVSSLFGIGVGTTAFVSRAFLGWACTF